MDEQDRMCKTMQKKTTAVLSLVAVLALLTATVPTSGNHDFRNDDRIVQPYGLQVITHIPVVAGYEPVPAPLVCAPGAPVSDPYYQEDFEGTHGWSFPQTPLSFLGENLWHVTDWSGPGTDDGVGGADRLYFGLPEDSSQGIGGTFEVDSTHVAGTAQSPPITLPEQPGLMLSFNTKWAVEWLKGYDHMWVELQDESGTTHILCTNNSADRGEGTSTGNSHRIGACSPILFGPCPTGSPGGDANDYPLEGLPAWHTRTIVIGDEFAGQTVRLRFTFDSADGVANQFMGWMVDDVRIGHE